MCIGDVAHIGEVEHVCVGAELEPGFVGVIDVYYWGEDLDVALAEDASGAEGAG